MSFLDDITELSAIFLGLPSQYRSSSHPVLISLRPGPPKVSINEAPEYFARPCTLLWLDPTIVRAAWDRLSVCSIGGEIVLDASIHDDIAFLGPMYRVLVVMRVGRGSSLKERFAVRTGATMVVGRTAKIAKRRAVEYARAIGSIDWNATDVWHPRWLPPLTEITDARVVSDKRGDMGVLLSGRRRFETPRRSGRTSVVCSETQMVQQADDGRWAAAEEYAGLDGYYRWILAEKDKRRPKPISEEDEDALAGVII